MVMYSTYRFRDVVRDQCTTDYKSEKLENRISSRLLVTRMSESLTELIWVGYQIQKMKKTGNAYSQKASDCCKLIFRDILLTESIYMVVRKVSSENQSLLWKI